MRNINNKEKNQKKKDEEQMEISKKIQDLAMRNIQLVNASFRWCMMLIISQFRFWCLAGATELHKF